MDTPARERRRANRYMMMAMLKIFVEDFNRDEQGFLIELLQHVHAQGAPTADRPLRKTTVN